MAEYYLISQLPSLDGLGENTPLPISEEAFFELCQRFLNKRDLAQIKGLTIAPNIEGEPSDSPLVNGWNQGERELRLALCSLRAQRLGRDYKAPTAGEAVMQIARRAVQEKNPMEAQRLLTGYRLELLESLRPTDGFSREYLFYYGIKLKLLSRTRQFDKEGGERAYKNIYGSILNGARVEAAE